MKVFISADIEGVGGVVSGLHTNADSIHYSRACSWMTQEVNAAVEGAVQAGAKTVLVKDGHDSGVNINLEALHPAAELISGWGPLNSMVEGIDESFDALLLIGYHARGETLDGTLAHTWSSHVLDLRINDRTVGEAGWAAATAGHFGVPLALVSGDSRLAAQVREELPGGFHTVITKTGLAPHAARMRPIVVVHREIREGVVRALRDRGSLPVCRPELPATITVRFRHWERLDACEAVPGVERIDASTFQYRAADFLEAHRNFVTLHRLARQ